MADEKKGLFSSIKDAFNNVTDKLTDGKGFTGGISAKEFFGNIATSIRNKLLNIKNHITDGYDVSEDSVHVLSGTKTLLGNDFSELYTKADTCVKNTNMGKKSFIKPNTSYDSDLYTGTFKSGTNTTYGDMTPTKKAAMEITLLTKKYASQYDANDNVKNQETVTNYKKEINKYKNYCDKHNMNWTQVMSMVSTEFQEESAIYKDKGLSSDRQFANLSHCLMVAATKDTYKDTLTKSVEGKGLSYADTMSLDVGNNDVKSMTKGVINKAGDTVKNVFDGAMGLVQTAVEPIKESLTRSDTVDQDVGISGQTQSNEGTGYSK